MAVRFNNYQPGAQLAAALDQADRQYQDKLALGWVPSERDPDQNIFGSFWDSLTSSAESTLGGALTAAGVVSDSPWLAGVGGDLTRQAARYSDWANDYDNNPDKSRWSLGYFLDPHGLYSDAGTMLGSSAPGMLAGAALAAGGGAVLPALAVLGSAGLEVGANFGQSYMDAKRDNIEAQIKAGQRPTGTVYDGDIDQAAWDSFTGDPYKNAELIGSSFMDTALDVATGATGGLFSLAGKGLAKAGIADALASNGGKVAGAVLGDAARADTLLGRAAYGLSTASKPIDFIGNRVANAFGEGFQEAWQQRVQDAMANKFDDNRADAGSFFRDIANGDWNNFTDDEINSFNSAFLPTLVSGVGVAGARNVGRYMYNNIDSLGPTVEAKRDYNDLMQTTGIANALADSTDLSDYIGHVYTNEPTDTEPVAYADNKTSVGLPQTNEVPVSYNQTEQELPTKPLTEPMPSIGEAVPTGEGQSTGQNDALSKVVDSTRAKMADLPDILTRAYNNADIDAINKNIPEGDTKLSPELLNKAVQGSTNAAYYILSNLDRKNVVQAIRERNNERKAQAKQAKQELDATKDDIKNVIKGVGKKDNNEEAIQKAQDIIYSLAPNGKAEELADKTKSRFLKVNQPLLDRANNGDTKAIRDVLRAVDPNAYMVAKNKQEQKPVEDVADVPVERPVVEETQQTVRKPQEPQKQAQQEQKTPAEQTSVVAEQEAVPQKEAEQPQTLVQTEVSPLSGVARPQETQVVPTQTEQTAQQVQQQSAQNAQNAANQGYSMEKTEEPDEVGKTTQPATESVDTNKDSKSNVIANINEPNGLSHAREIIGQLHEAGYVNLPKDTWALFKTADENTTKSMAVSILKQVSDDDYNRVVGTNQEDGAKNTAGVADNKNVAALPKQESVSTDKNARANVIANINEPNGLDRARNIIAKLSNKTGVKLGESDKKTLLGNDDAAKNLAKTILEGYDDDTYNKIIGVDSKSAVASPTQKNVADNVQPSEQSDYPNSKANVIANANTPEGLKRAHHILTRLRKGKHVKVGKETAKKIASKDPEVSRPAIIQTLQDIDDDTYNSFMKIPKGEKNENTQTSESTEGSTNNQTETRTETGRNAHQQGRLNDNGTSSETKSSETSEKQTDKKEVVPPQSQEKTENKEEDESKLNELQEKDNHLFTDDGGEPKESNEKKVVISDEDIESGVAELRSSLDFISHQIRNRNKKRKVLTSDFVDEESVDAKANRRFNNYRNGELRKHMTDLVGSFYGTMNRMSFANLMTMMPNARLYVSFLGGAHKFATSEEEFLAKMHYMAIFGSLASLGINELRSKMGLVIGADRNGKVKYEDSTSFARAYNDLLDILPGAIHEAIATYDGVYAKMKAEAAGSEKKDVASLSTWFTYVLRTKYNQYVIDRGDSSLTLFAFDSKQVYSAVNELLPGAGAKTREEKQAARNALQWMKVLPIPEELHEYGIKTFSDVVSWLLEDNNQNVTTKTTGRMEIVAAINNAMVRGPYAEELKTLLKQAKSPKDYAGNYGRVFMQAFKSAFLSVINTPEGNVAWDTYNTMQHLNSAANKIIINEVGRISPDIIRKANEYGKTFITQMAYETQSDGFGNQTRTRDIEIDKYINDTMKKLESMVLNNKSLTKEGKAVAISKANIILQALSLAEAAKDKYLKPETDAEREKAANERAMRMAYKARLREEAKRKAREEGDDKDYGDKSHDQTGGGVDGDTPVYSDIDYDFANHYNLQLARSEDYLDTTKAARYLSILSFEVQLCNELDTGMYKEMLKQKNQDGAYLSSTEKANLMIAFIVKTVLDNYGDLAESEFAQHKDSSDADEVRKYAESLIKQINLLFPTAQTYREGLEYAGVSMKNFDEGLNKICQDIQDKENTFGRKLFGLSYSKNIISKMRVNGEEVNRLVSRRTTKFPWLNTNTSSKIMSSEIFEESKFVSKFIRNNKLKFDEISVSDLLPTGNENNKRKQVSPKVYKTNMKTLGYSADVAKGLGELDNKWIERLWEKCSKNKKVEKETYDREKKDFINRWGNAINRARRAVLAVAISGSGHTSPTDSSAALRLGFAVDRAITPVDAILFSKAMEAKIKYIADRMVEEENTDATSAIRGNRSRRDNTQFYVFASGPKQNHYAGEIKDKHIVSYDGHKYALTDKQYKDYEKDNNSLGQMCQPDNRVVKMARNEASLSAAAGKTPEESRLVNTHYAENFAKRRGSERGDSNYRMRNSEYTKPILESSGTVVGAIDTLISDYFSKDASGIPYNLIVRVLMVLDTGLPKETIINNGIEGYIKQVAQKSGKQEDEVRKIVMGKIESAVNKFTRLEQLEIAGQARTMAFDRLKDNGKEKGVDYVEGKNEFRDTINLIASQVENQGDKYYVEIKTPKLNYQDKSIDENRYVNSWAYTKLREAILGAIGLMDWEGDGYKVEPLAITNNSPIKNIKSSYIDIHDTDSTKWKAKKDISVIGNPIAALLQYLGSLDKSDLTEEYGKDIPFTIKDLMEDPRYNYLMMAHNDALMGSDGLITSLHTFSYRLAQQDKLTYTDIANLCALVAIASQRLRNIDDIKTFAEHLESAVEYVGSSPKRLDAENDIDKKLPKLAGTSTDLYYNTENPPMYQLKPRSRESIEDMDSRGKRTYEAKWFRVNKENTAFLGTEFANKLDGDVANKFAHLSFVNAASKTLGVAPYIHNVIEGNSRYRESTGRLQARVHRSTVYHELMHAFTDQAITVDLAKDEYRLATPADERDVRMKYDRFGTLAVNENAPDVPEGLLPQAEKAIKDAISNELTDALEIIEKNNSLLAQQLLAITELVNVNKLVDYTAHVWTYSNLVGFDETKTGKARFVSKVGATALDMFYENSDKTDYEVLVMNMILPSIIYGAKVVSKKMPLFYNTKTIITETYSHLNSKLIAGDDSSDFMTDWLYKSTQLLNELQSRDPAFELRNKDKDRMRDEMSAAFYGVQELTQETGAPVKSVDDLFERLEKDTSDSEKPSSKGKKTLDNNLVDEPNEYARIDKKKKKNKKNNIGTGKGAITTVRDVSQDAGSPHGWFMQLLYAIANKRNKTFAQTHPSEVNHAKDIKLAWMPGMRWLEEFVSKADSDRLFDKSQRCIAWQQELNARSDAYVKQLQQLLTIKGNELQTKALRQYFNTEINVNSDRGRDLVELVDLPYEAGQDERCKNRSPSGRNAMIKVYNDDVFFVIHNEPDKATAMAKMNKKIEQMKAYYKEKKKTFYKNQAFWYREDTGTLVFYACKDERMQNGKFKNLFIAYPSNEDGTDAEGQARMRARLQKQVLKECEQLRRKVMKQRGYAQPIIDRFIASQALYRALLMNAYSREQKRALQNDDIINRIKTGFLHAYAPRYYARYILQKEVWHEVDEKQVNQKSKDEGFIIQRGDKNYRVITYSIGSFESKSERAKYRNEHPIGKNERYVEKTRDEWLQEQGGGRTDIVGNVDTAIGTLTNKDVERGKKEAAMDIAGKLAKFISKKFNDNEEWQGEDSINRIVDALRNMNEEDEKEFGKYKPRLIQTAKMIHVDKDNAQTFLHVSRALRANGAQYLAANYARERTSNSGLYSHDVIGSLKHYLHTVNSVEALTPFYRDMTQTIYKHTNRNYDRTKRDSYYSEYNIMCELVDNMNGRDKPVDGFMRRLSVMVVDAIYAVPGMRSILNACGVYLPDMWLPALLHNSIAINVYLKLGMFNVSTALAQYAQLANVYALGGGEAFAYAMKKMPGILSKAHKPSDILKNDFDVSKYGKEIQQVMADLYLTKKGKTLLEQDGEKAFHEALERGDKTAIELQVFDEMCNALTGKDDGLVMNDVAAQLGNAGSAYEGESLIDKMPTTGKKILDLSMGGFRGADLACRLFAALTAQHILDTSPKYKKFRESRAEIGEEEYNAQRMLMIRDFVYRTNFNFNRATDPLLLAKGGQLAKCVFQFASYGFQTFHFMYWMLKNKKSTELKRFLGTMMLFSGVISGLPMMTMISGMAQAITGTNPEDWIKSFILKAVGKRGPVPQAIGEALCYGIAAPVLGVDISKKVGLSDIMKDPTDLRNLGGPSLGTAIDFSSAVGASYDAILYDKYTTDQLMFAWLKAVPAASRWLQAARGQYYSYSKLMPKTEYQSMSNADRAKNFMGFNPIENKLDTDINRFITDENQEYSNKAKDAMIAYVNNPTEANLKKLQDYGKTPEQAHKTVDKYIKPKITAEQAEKMVTKSKSEEAEIVRSDVRALGNLLS